MKNCNFKVVAPIDTIYKYCVYEYNLGEHFHIEIKMYGLK